MARRFARLQIARVLAGTMTVSANHFGLCEFSQDSLSGSLVANHHRDGGDLTFKFQMIEIQANRWINLPAIFARLTLQFSQILFPFRNALATVLVSDFLVVLLPLAPQTEADAFGTAAKLLHSLAWRVREAALILGRRPAFPPVNLFHRFRPLPVYDLLRLRQLAWQSQASWVIQHFYHLLCVLFVNVEIEHCVSDIARGCFRFASDGFVDTSPTKPEARLE